MPRDQGFLDDWNMADDEPLELSRSSPAARSRSALAGPAEPSTRLCGDVTATGCWASWSPSSDDVYGFTLNLEGCRDSAVTVGAASQALRADEASRGPRSMAPPTTRGASTSRGISLRVGDEIGGFRLKAELGRGAFARVFLAEEVSLGDRLVVLKISKAQGDEPQILARMQHAHIVPVHSVHDDPATGLRLLCMPFLGGANLAQVLEESRGVAASGATGRGLVEALDQLSERLPASVGESLFPSRRSQRASRAGSRGLSTVRGDVSGLSRVGGAAIDGGAAARSGRRSWSGALSWLVGRLAGSPVAPEASDADDELLPSRRFLRRADVIRASVWIVARLAEGLDHAHSRGLLHRDLKPSNILIAADGTPMLLDFNLSVEAPLGDEPAEESARRAMLGGTLPYMAPEHLDALDPNGSTHPDAVDERSDIYSLGLILFEMIAGAPAFATRETPSASLGLLRDMVRERSHAPTPSLRDRLPEVPPSLDALVGKCLDPDPARRYVSAGELAEDLRRFLDDLPMRHAPEPSLVERAAKWTRRHPALCGTTSIVIASVVLVGLLGFAAFQARERAGDLRSRLKLRVFQRDARECRFLLNTLGDDDKRLRQGLKLAAATLRDAGVVDPLDASSLRSEPGGDWIARLNGEERESVHRSIIELMLQETQARVELASRLGDERARRSAVAGAVARLDAIERLVVSPPPILLHLRAGYRDFLGDKSGAAADRNRAWERPPVTSDGWAMLGAFLLAEGDLDSAEQALREALALDLTSFWAWFAMGHCHFERGRFAEAVADFTACVVARPDVAWAHFNRGVALARAGRPLEAKEAFGKALALDPDFTEARRNRGLIELQLDQSAEAEADLRATVSRGRLDPTTLSALGDAMARQGRAEAAEQLFGVLVAQTPDNAALRAARGVTRTRTNPAAAMADFRAALAVDPRHPLAHLGMARSLRATDRPAALVHLDQAIEADPDLLDARELRALERARAGLATSLDDIEVLLKNPTANRLYNAACALAILGETTRRADHLARAVEVLEMAFKAGFPVDKALADDDLALLRDRGDFGELMRRCGRDDWRMAISNWSSSPGGQTFLSALMKSYVGQTGMSAPREIVSRADGRGTLNKRPFYPCSRAAASRSKSKLRGISRPWASSNSASARTSRLGPSATTWPASSRMARGQTSSAISRSCVAISLAQGSDWISWMNRRRPRGSRFAVGSSSARTEGPQAKTPARQTRFRSPKLR